MYDEIDYVYEVYREKSFSAAAKNLYVSQPALSSAIKKIESRLGITVFDRSSQPIKLTDEGKVYIEAIEQIYSIKKSMQTRLCDISRLKSGHITVSGENYISSFIYPKIIIEFMERYSGIEIEMVESNSHDLQNRLLGEEVDLLIDYKFDPQLYDSYPLVDEHIILCVPKKLEINERLRDYQLSAKDIKSGKHLKNVCPGVRLREFSEETFVYPDQMITSYNMSRAGMGISLIPDLLIYASPESGKCVYYKLLDASSLRRLCLGFKKNRYMSRAVEAFIKTALEVYGK